MERNELDRQLHSNVVDAVQRHVPSEHITRELIAELTRLCVVPVPFTLAQLQAEVADWATRNFGKRETWHPLLGVVEEVGELSHAHLKQTQGIRGSTLQHTHDAMDAVGDAIIYLADYCALRGFNLHSIVEETWSEVKQRNWQANKETGDAEEAEAEDEARAQV
jgi:NTP pyrophosphatase (non-canonical NTP hydrolase)